MLKNRIAREQARAHTPEEFKQAIRNLNNGNRHVLSLVFSGRSAVTQEITFDQISNLLTAIGLQYNFAEGSRKSFSGIFKDPNAPKAPPTTKVVVRMHAPHGGNKYLPTYAIIEVGVALIRHKLVDETLAQELELGAFPTYLKFANDPSWRSDRTVASAQVAAASANGNGHHGNGQNGHSVNGNGGAPLPKVRLVGRHRDSVNAVPEGYRLPESAQSMMTSRQARAENQDLYAALLSGFLFADNFEDAVNFARERYEWISKAKAHHGNASFPARIIQEHLAVLVRVLEVDLNKRHPDVSSALRFKDAFAKPYGAAEISDLARQKIPIAVVDEARIFGESRHYLVKAMRTVDSEKPAKADKGAVKPATKKQIEPPATEGMDAVSILSAFHIPPNYVFPKDLAEALRTQDFGDADKGSESRYRLNRFWNVCGFMVRAAQNPQFTAFYDQLVGETKRQTNMTLPGFAHIAAAYMFFAATPKNGNVDIDALFNQPVVQEIKPDQIKKAILNSRLYYAFREAGALTGEMLNTELKAFQAEWSASIERNRAAQARFEADKAARMAEAVCPAESKDIKVSGNLVPPELYVDMLRQAKFSSGKYDVMHADPNPFDRMVNPYWILFSTRDLCGDAEGKANFETRYAREFMKGDYCGRLVDIAVAQRILLALDPKSKLFGKFEEALLMPLPYDITIETIAAAFQRSVLKATLKPYTSTKNASLDFQKIVNHHLRRWEETSKEAAKAAARQGLSPEAVKAQRGIAVVNARCDYLTEYYAAQAADNAKLTETTNAQARKIADQAASLSDALQRLTAMTGAVASAAGLITTMGNNATGMEASLDEMGRRLKVAGDAAVSMMHVDPDSAPPAHPHEAVICAAGVIKGKNKAAAEQREVFLQRAAELLRGEQTR